MLFHAFLGFALGSAGAEAHGGKWSGWQGCFSTWRMPSESAALAQGQRGCHWPTHRAVSAGMGQHGRHPSAPTRSASKPMVILHLLVGPAVFCFCILGFFLPPVQPISVLHPLWPKATATPTLIQDRGTCEACTDTKQQQAQNSSCLLMFLSSSCENIRVEKH